MKNLPNLSPKTADHIYHTRSATKRLLDIPCFNTNFKGTQSAKYHCIIDRNNFLKKTPKGNAIRTHTHRNKITTKRTLSQPVLLLS